MTKRVGLLCFAAVFCYSFVEANSLETRAAPKWNPDDTAPSVEAVTAAAAHAQSSHCRTQSCRAIIVIHETIAIGLYEAGNANGRASILAYHRPVIAGHRLDRLLLTHPELFQSVCMTGRKLISRFRTAPGVYEMAVPVQLMLNAVDMDLHGHGHCAADLAEALPHDNANDIVRLNAGSLCVNGWEDHVRPAAACAVITNGIIQPR